MYSVKCEKPQSLEIFKCFCLPVPNENDKTFLLRQGDDILGLGVIYFKSEKQARIEFSGSGDSKALSDMLARTMLFSLKDEDNLSITSSEGNIDLLSLGFSQRDDGQMEIISNMLKFNNNCNNCSR